MQQLKLATPGPGRSAFSCRPPDYLRCGGSVEPEYVFSSCCKSYQTCRFDTPGTVVHNPSRQAGSVARPRVVTSFTAQSPELCHCIRQFNGSATPNVLPTNMLLVEGFCQNTNNWNDDEWKKDCLGPAKLTVRPESEPDPINQRAAERLRPRIVARHSSTTRPTRPRSVPRRIAPEVPLPGGPSTGD